MPKPPDPSHDPSGFSRAEIAAVVLGLAVPVVLFALLLIPGAMAAVIGFLTQRSVAPFAFGGAAAVVAAILAVRIWTRVHRRRDGGGAKPDARKRTSAFWDLWRGPDN